MTGPASGPTLKIGISGVRGIAGRSLTPQIVTSFSAAFGTYAGRGDIVVGSDTRPSREMVTSAVFSGLLGVGCRPVNVGIVPVPTLQHRIRERSARGGICITASHNPLEWNALKFCGSDGTTLRPDQFAQVIDLYHQGLYPWVPAGRLEEIEDDPAAVAGHLRAVLDLVDLDSIRSRSLKVVIDCCNGAGSSVAPAFLRSLGCEVIELHCDPTQPFPRDPEPLRQHLSDLCLAVQDCGADLGLALDADADRLALVDEQGVAIGEDCTVALAVRHWLARKPGPVVVNLSTSQMVDEVAREFGCTVYRSPVGETHVLRRMFELGSEIGGEGNGGVIIPSVNPCRDAFVAMALILDSLALTRQSLASLRGRLPTYAIIKEKIPSTPRSTAAFLRLLRQLYRDSQLDLSDGVKVSWPDRWLHVRGSNTEPILRVVAEAATSEEAHQLVDGVMEYLRPLGGLE